MSLERVYTINLSKIYSVGRHRVRARKAIKHMKAFTKRHMKGAYNFNLVQKIFYPFAVLHMNKTYPKVEIEN